MAVPWFTQNGGGQRFPGRACLPAFAHLETVLFPRLVMAPANALFEISCICLRFNEPVRLI
jgi:hypothetical protein